MKTEVDVVRVKRIKAGSLAALVFSGSAMLMIPMCVLFGLCALFGARTVHFNGTYITGIGGFLLSLIYGPLFTGIVGVLTWPAAYLGIRVIGHFRPFSIEYVAPLDQRPNQALEPTATAVTPPAAQEPRQP